MVTASIYFIGASWLGTLPCSFLSTTSISYCTLTVQVVSMGSETAMISYGSRIYVLYKQSTAAKGRSISLSANCKAGTSKLLLCSEHTYCSVDFNRASTLPPEILSSQSSSTTFTLLDDYFGKRLKS